MRNLFILFISIMILGTSCQRECKNRVCPGPDQEYISWLKVHENKTLFFENDSAGRRTFYGGNIVNIPGCDESPCRPNDDNRLDCICDDCVLEARLGPSPDAPTNSLQWEFSYRQVRNLEEETFTSGQKFGVDMQSFRIGLTNLPFQENPGNIFFEGTIQIGTAVYEEVYKIKPSNTTFGYVLINAGDGIVAFQDSFTGLVFERVAE